MQQLTRRAGVPSCGHGLWWALPAAVGGSVLFRTQGHSLSPSYLTEKSGLVTSPKLSALTLSALFTLLEGAGAITECLLGI